LKEKIPYTVINISDLHCYFFAVFIHSTTSVVMINVGILKAKGICEMNVRLENLKKPNISALYTGTLQIVFKSRYQYSRFFICYNIALIPLFLGMDNCLTCIIWCLHAYMLCLNIATKLRMNKNLLIGESI